MVGIAIGFVLSFLIGAGCRYFDMDRIVSRKEHVATTRHLCGGPTGLPVGSWAPLMDVDLFGRSFYLPYAWAI